MSTRHAADTVPAAPPSRAMEIFRAVLQNQVYAAQLQITAAHIRRRSPFARLASRGVAFALAPGPCLKECRRRAEKETSDDGNSLATDIEQELTDYELQLTKLQASLGKKGGQDGAIAEKLKQISETVSGEKKNVVGLQADLTAAAEAAAAEAAALKAKLVDKQVATEGAQVQTVLDQCLLQTQQSKVWKEQSKELLASLRKQNMDLRKQIHTLVGT